MKKSFAFFYVALLSIVAAQAVPWMHLSNAPDGLRYAADSIPGDESNPRTMTISSAQMRSTSSENPVTYLQLPRVVPPSPTAASLGVFGDVPIGHYTGVPKITVPLYEISCGSYKLPITLSYHAGGIRVADEAGWAGLGWTLNAGGAITRSVAGVDDFNDWEYKGLKGYCVSPPTYHNEDEYLTDEQGGLYPTMDHFNRVYSGDYDGRPDVFSYNFGSYSGQMGFPRKKSEIYFGDFPAPLIFNREPIKVSYHREGAYHLDAGEWIVKTPDGAVHTFKTAELTRDSIVYHKPVSSLSYYIENKQPQVYTAWYLDKIETYDGKKIEFVYEKHAKIRSQGQGYANDGWAYEYLWAPNDISWRYDVLSYSYTIVEELLLKEVRFPGGKVAFETRNRDDLLYNGSKCPQALCGMSVVNSQNDTLQHYDFRMGYYNARESSALLRRLRLEGITAKDGRKWNFRYEGGRLPEKNSAMVDYWGYYNYKYFNSYYSKYSDIPLPMVVDTWNTNGWANQIILGAERNATDACMTGILSRIEYPTGGWTDFEYELHDFSNSDAENRYSDFKYKFEYLQESVQELDELVVNFTVHDPLPLHCLMICTYNQGFEKQSDEYIHFDYANEDFGPVDVVWRVQMKNSLGLWQDMQKMYFGNMPRANIVGRKEVHFTPIDYQLFQPGEYRIIMPTYQSTRAGIEMVIPRRKTTADYRGGGVRVRSIRSFDGTDTLETRYGYRFPGGISAGVAQMFPRTTYCSPKLVGRGAYGRTSTNLFSCAGPAVTYDFVRETKLLNGTEAYTTSYTFDNPYTDAGRILKCPGFPLRKFGQSGHLLSEKVTDKTGNLMSEKTYEYKLDENSCDSLEGLLVHCLYSIASSKTCMFNFYRHRAEWWYLDNERSIVWENGNPKISYTKYSYNEFRRQTTRTTTFYSDDREVKEEVVYSCNGSLTGPISADYRIDFPVENNTYVDGKLISSQYNVYGDGLIYNIMQKTDGQSDYETRIQIKWYNALNNPTYLIKDGTERVIYLWSYSGTYPVAEIKGATMEEVLAAIGQEENFSFFDELANQASPDMTLLGSLRGLLPNAQVWTYTYKPLFGILTATDPAGKTRYYDYDSSGRLSQIKDNAGNLVQSFEYHYKQ